MFKKIIVLLLYFFFKTGNIPGSGSVQFTVVVCLIISHFFYGIQ